MKKVAYLRKSDLEKIAEKHPIIDSVDDLRGYNPDQFKLEDVGCIGIRGTVKNRWVYLLVYKKREDNKYHFECIL